MSSSRPDPTSERDTTYDWLADTGGGGAAPPAPSAPPADVYTPPPVETRVEVYWVRIDRWHAHQDDRTCPACLALDWHEFEEDDGPWPPLHAHCRCGREVGARYEARTREVTTGSGGRYQ